MVSNVTNMSSFLPLEVVDDGSETQPHVVEKENKDRTWNAMNHEKKNSKLGLNIHVLLLIIINIKQIVVISRWEFTSDAGIAILAINQPCNKISLYPANRRHWPNVVLFLGQRWVNDLCFLGIRDLICIYQVAMYVLWFYPDSPGGDVCPMFSSVFDRWRCMSGVADQAFRPRSGLLCPRPCLLYQGIWVQG